MCRICLLLATGAYAQSDRGIITGTVVDPDGAVVPGASVVAENPENGARYETVTTQTGNYTLAQMPVGTYNLSVESRLRPVPPGGHPHLRRSNRPNRREAAARQSRGRSERCGRCVDARHPKRGNRFERDRAKNLNSLPLNFGARGNQAAAAIRNPYSFVTLVPGGNISSYSSLKVGGAPLNTFQIRVEGMSRTTIA